MFTRTIRSLVWCASGFACLAFIVLASTRFPAERLVTPDDGVILDHAVRFASGTAAYVAPTTAQAISPMPGFPWVVSFLVAALGPQLWVPRVASLLFSLIAAVLAMFIVRAETKSWTVGAASGGILLLGLTVLTGHPEAARPEPLALALGLAGLLVLRHVPGYVGAIGSALILSAAFFVHPLALWVIGAAIAYLVAEQPKLCLVFVLAVAVGCGGGYVTLSNSLGEWFNFSAFDGPLSALRFRPSRVLHYIGDVLLGRLGVLTLSTVMAFALPTRPWRGPTGLWTWVAFAAMASGLVATQSLRVSPADMIPVMTALALIGPISVQRVTQHLSAWPGSSRLGGRGVVLTALVLQFVMLFAGVSAALLSPLV
jgi:hypothetical protein